MKQIIMGFHGDSCIGGGYNGVQAKHVKSWVKEGLDELMKMVANGEGKQSKHGTFKCQIVTDNLNGRMSISFPRLDAKLQLPSLGEIEGEEVAVELANFHRLKHILTKREADQVVEMAKFCNIELPGIE